MTNQIILIIKSNKEKSLKVPIEINSEIQNQIIGAIYLNSLLNLDLLHRRKYLFDLFKNIIGYHDIGGF
jgi:hypothetical protein